MTEADAQEFRAVRLRGLREDPIAFGSSYEDEVQRPLDHTIERLRGSARRPGSFTIGAFDPEADQQVCVALRR